MRARSKILAVLRLCALALATAIGGCKKSPAPTPASSAPARAAAPSAEAPRSPKEAPLAGERVEIPGGSFFAGSVPGDPGRVPELEPRRTELELGPFQIDRLPYPNDPARPPLTSVTRDDARRLCAERSLRLCTELEWERACKGPNSDAFASGAAWDARCEKAPAACASGFEVLAMGAGIAEWTASELSAVEPGAGRRAVARGASASAPAVEHRCANRRPLDPESKQAELGFRCCSGAPNATTVPEPAALSVFKKTRLGADALEKLLAREPATRALAKDLRFFKEPDSAETVVARGPGDRKGFNFSVAPLLWSPVAGAEFLLVSARSGENTSFVVAFYTLGGDDYRLAASFVMKGEPGPIAFAFDDSIRPRLHFSSCWGCPGETGKILFRKPERVVILQP